MIEILCVLLKKYALITHLNDKTALKAPRSPSEPPKSRIPNLTLARQIQEPCR